MLVHSDIFMYRKILTMVIVMLYGGIYLTKNLQGLKFAAANQQPSPGCWFGFLRFF